MSNSLAWHQAPHTKGPSNYYRARALLSFKNSLLEINFRQPKQANCSLPQAFLKVNTNFAIPPGPAQAPYFLNLTRLKQFLLPSYTVPYSMP